MPDTHAPTSGSPVTLRRVSPADAEMIFAWRSEPSTRRYQPIRQIPLDAVREQLTRRSRHPIDPSFDGEAQWVVQASGTPVGWMTLEVVSREHRIGSVGYTIAEPYWGHGYATAGLKSTLELALSPEGANLWRVEAVAAITNGASRRVLAKAGFQEEGIARDYLEINGARVDHVRMAILRPDWLALRRADEYRPPSGISP
jgi:ribosomal-protein-alanine N-acetyltransferase